MTIVSTMGGTKVQDFWKGFLPGNNAQEPIVWHRKRDRWASISYKDLHAQAHCAAAYLMTKGLRKGDYVAILSAPTIDYLVLDIALQFLGAINVSLPADLSHADMEQQLNAHTFQFVYYGSPDSFKAHDQLCTHKEALQGVLIASEEVDDLDPDKIVTFDRVVNLGKAAWRENTAALNAAKDSVTEQDAYTILHPSPLSGESQSITLRYRDLLAAVSTAEQQYQDSKTRLILNLLSPPRLQQRSHGMFAALRLQIPFYILPSANFSPATLSELSPHVLITDPAGLQKLYQDLPELLGGGSSAQKALQKALTVVQKRDEALSQGKKNPFLNRMRYRMGNKKLYRRVRAQMGGKVQFLWVDKGTIAPEVQAFFDECELKILR